MHGGAAGHFEGFLLKGGEAMALTGGAGGQDDELFLKGLVCGDDQAGGVEPAASRDAVVIGGGRFGKDGRDGEGLIDVKKGDISGYRRAVGNAEGNLVSCVESSARGFMGDDGSIV